MKFPRLLNLRGISGQIAALVVVSIAALHLIVTGIFWLHRPDTPDPAIDRGHSHFLASVELLGKAPSAERPRLIADITRTFPQLDIRLLAPDADTTAVEPDNRVLRTLHRHRTTVLPTRSLSSASWDEIWSLTAEFYDAERAFVETELRSRQSVALFRMNGVLLGMASIDIRPERFRGRAIAVISRRRGEATVHNCYR